MGQACLLAASPAIGSFKRPNDTGYQTPMTSDPAPHSTGTMPRIGGTLQL